MHLCNPWVIVCALGPLARTLLLSSLSPFASVSPPLYSSPSLLVARSPLPSLLPHFPPVASLPSPLLLTPPSTLTFARSSPSLSSSPSSSSSSLLSPHFPTYAYHLIIQTLASSPFRPPRVAPSIRPPHLNPDKGARQIPTTPVEPSTDLVCNLHTHRAQDARTYPPTTHCTQSRSLSAVYIHPPFFPLPLDINNLYPYRPDAGERFRRHSLLFPFTPTCLCLSRFNHPVTSNAPQPRHIDR